MKLTIKAYLSKEKFFALPTSEQREKAKKSEVYKRYLAEGKGSGKSQTKTKKPAANPSKEVSYKKLESVGKANGKKLFKANKAKFDALSKKDNYWDRDSKGYNVADKLFIKTSSDLLAKAKNPNDLTTALFSILEFDKGLRESRLRFHEDDDRSNAYYDIEKQMNKSLKKYGLNIEDIAYYVIDRREGLIDEDDETAHAKVKKVYSKLPADTTKALDRLGDVFEDFADHYDMSLGPN